MSAKPIIPFSNLTGGTDDSYLDSWDGAGLSDGQMAFGIVDGKQYAYILDADSGAAENSPYVIAPDSNAGTKRWLSQLPGGPFSHVKAKSDAGQSIGNESDTTLIHEDGVRDTLSEHSTSVGVFTAKYSGDYAIKVGCLFASRSWAVGQVIILKAYIESVEDVEIGRAIVQNAFTGSFGLNASTSIYLSATDTLEVRAYQNSGGSISLRSDSDKYNWITIDRLA